jgi:hypothetical protein
MPIEIGRRSAESSGHGGRKSHTGEPGMLRSLLCVLCVLCGLFSSGCADSGVKMRFLRSESYTFSRAEQRLITGISESTFAEVRRILPGTPERIEITVRPGTDVSPEIGQGGDAMPPNGIMWRVDPTRHGGVEAIAKAWLRACLFHELHHLARYPSQPPQSIIEHAVTEGMATAFERDFAGVTPLWGAYPGNVAEWAAEFEKLPAETPRDHWLFRHPDGRRWIGYKVGTYWVDQARARTGRSAVDLVGVPAGDLLEMGRRDR